MRYYCVPNTEYYCDTAVPDITYNSTELVCWQHSIGGGREYCWHYSEACAIYLE